MKCSSLGLIGAAICVAHAGQAFASAGGEPQPAGKPLAGGSRSAMAARPGTFAAAAAPFARRLTPQQREEWRFLKDAAASSHFENDAAHMALAKSSDPKVRSLAAALVNHHASAQAALQQMLHVRNMALPMLSGEQRKSLNHLAKLQGAKFDREWMEAVALGSQHDGVLAYEHAAGAVGDRALRSWIQRTLPAMRYQLATAERAVTGETKFATLAPAVTSSVIKSASIATRSMGAAPATGNPADLGEGNMLLGPARPVAVRLSEPNIR